MSSPAATSSAPFRSPMERQELYTHSPYAAVQFGDAEEVPPQTGCFAQRSHLNGSLNASGSSAKHSTTGVFIADHRRSISVDSSYSPGYSAGGSTLSPMNAHRRSKSDMPMSTYDCGNNGIARQSGSWSPSASWRSATPETHLWGSQQTADAGSNAEAAYPMLGGFCEYIALPTEDQLVWVGLPGFQTEQKTEHQVFFGQLRFEITERQMIWLILRLTRATCSPVFLHSRNPGCFSAYFRTAEEAVQVRRFHQRLLCDRTGLWFAATSDAAAVLAEFIAEKESIHGLPRGAVIVRR